LRGIGENGSVGIGVKGIKEKLVYEVLDRRSWRRNIQGGKIVMMLGGEKNRRISEGKGLIVVKNLK